MSRSDAGVLDWPKNGVLAFRAFDALSLGHCAVDDHSGCSEAEIQISEVTI
jgi:hypothetical protein